MKKTILFLVSIYLLSSASGQIKVACIGNSITFGYGWNNPKSYPSQLDSLLGGGWQVRNFGVPGATMLRRGDLPYHKLTAYVNAREFAPDVVIIKLGTNDSKPQNWDSYGREFVNDYDSMITELRSLRSKPFIILCTPVPAFSSAYGIRDSIIRLEIPLVQAIAKKLHLKLIDLYDPLSGHREWFPDGIHPDEFGLAQMAATISKYMLEWKGEIEERSR